MLSAVWGSVGKALWRAAIHVTLVHFSHSSCHDWCSYEDLQSVSFSFLIVEPEITRVKPHRGSRLRQRESVSEGRWWRWQLLKTDQTSLFADWLQLCLSQEKQITFVTIFHPRKSRDLWDQVKGFRAFPSLSVSNSKKTKRKQRENTSRTLLVQKKFLYFNPFPGYIISTYWF